MGKLTEWEIDFLKNNMKSIKKDGVLVMLNIKYSDNYSNFNNEVVKSDNSNILQEE